ncbi:MAG: glycosyltransferase family 4 protein [Clostridia bacterium]
MEKLKVLMLGPARDVKGGMTSVIDNYFKYGLDKKVDLKYVETVNDKSKISKLLKEIKGRHQFLCEIPKSDIVHIHMASRRSTFRKIKYIKASKKYNKKVVLHIHGAEFKMFFDNECSEKQKEYIKNNLNLVDKIIVLSEEWKDYFKNIVNEEKIEVIYNSIMIPDDFEKNTDSKKILFLGRFGKRKGIYDLIDVIEQICKIYPETKLLAGGDGETEQVKKIIEDKHLENNITILGWVTGKKKEKYLRECSYYILPSYNEGMPMSLIEGMAYKNISISTNVGGIPKVIINNQNGILINAGNKEELYNSIKTTFENKELRKKLSENARKTIEKKFNINNNIEKLLEVYYKL